MPIKSSREERLQKIIARAGLASRRAAEQMIVEGRVQVDGRVVKELGAKADPDQSDIRVDGKRIRIEPRRRYIVLNKPRGCVTTRSDPGGRPTVMELLPHSLSSLYPVGRLDMSSTGLLLLTDDGDFAQRVGHPRFGIEKTYVVTVRGTPSDRTLERARNGIRIEGERLKVKSVHVLGSRPRRKRIFPQPSPMPRRQPGSGVAYWRAGPKRERDKVETARLDVVLVEGKNREVRRLFKALGHPVLELHRSRIGVLSDRGLPEGMFRPLSSLEIRQLKSPQPERSASAASRGARARRAPSEGRPDGSGPKPAADRSELVERRTRARAKRERPLRNGSASPASRGASERRAPTFEKASASHKTSAYKSAKPRRGPIGGGGKKERTDRVPPSPRPPSGAPRRVSPKSPVKFAQQPKERGSRWKGKGRAASAKAFASVNTSSDKSAGPRRSSKSGGGKGRGGAFSKISKKPGRRAKKDT